MSDKLPELHGGPHDIAPAGKYDYRITRWRTRTGRNTFDTDWLVFWTGGRIPVDFGKSAPTGAVEIGRASNKREAKKIAQLHWNLTRVTPNEP